MNGYVKDGALNSYHVSCARAIADITRDRGLDKRAALIAITTAIAESSLHNYTEPNDLARRPVRSRAGGT
ncbi:hypothetical protein [Micromonospora zamorensis]|uniref:hypothetical protein n=1 Tax=Micromonospora zamorensis TaxID=709883 RepID=UPI00081FCB02|nr:hypothetical protein [Micromonospora zamorensis]SCG40898.1 hypothetical protein GA0070619_1032 [Micromonospora zamorensis]